MANVNKTDSTAVASTTITIRLKSYVAPQEGPFALDGRMNLATTPSFEAAQGGSLTWGAGNSGSTAGVTFNLQSTDFALYGAQSGMFQSQGATGQYYGLLQNINPVVGAWYTCSVYIYIPVGSLITTISFGLRDTTSFNFIKDINGNFAQTINLTPGTWTRASVTAIGGTLQSDGTNSAQWMLSVADPNNCSNVNTGTWYIDGTLVEVGQSLNAYFDGNTAGAVWTGTTNQSTSITSAPNVAIALADTVSKSDSTAVSDTPTIEIILEPSVIENEAIQDQRTNFVINPSFEADTPGNGNNPANWAYANNSGTITYEGVANDFSQYGTNSVKIAASTAAVQLFNANINVLTGQTVTLSGWIKTDTNVTNAGLVIYDNGNVSYVSKGANVNGRFSVTATITGSGLITVSMMLGAYNGASSGTVWFDGIMLEVSPTAGTYFDGSIAGANWTGTANASTSITSYPYVNIELFSNINITDSTAVTDTSTIRLLSYINKTDSSVVSDTVSIDTVLQMSVTDSSAVSDTVQVQTSTPGLNPSDTTTVTATPSIEIVLLVSVTDSSAVSDTPKMGGTEYIRGVTPTYIFNDTGVIFNSTTVNFNGTVPFETTTVSDTVSIQTVDEINVSDSTAVSDTVQILIVLTISKTDSTAVPDTVVIEDIEEGIVVTDSTAVSETVTLRFNASLAITDSTAVSDIPQLELISYISVTDTSAESDTVIVEIVAQGLNVNDSTPVSESIKVEVFSYISTTNTTPVSDTPNFSGTSYINVTDSSVATDTVTIELISRISVQETITLTDNAAIFVINGARVNSSDTTTVTDQAVIELVLLLSTSDSTAVTDTVNAHTRYYVFAFSGTIALGWKFAPYTLVENSTEGAVRITYIPT